ncbi:hypothetical protein AB0G15_19580 [Streptosporangium sp. NPDC023825]|uniref:hypothetical protein n=1 Tax=Streptosporangium sp. NPDC023825 TaxID=3154909 RepID=UPI00341B2014
MYDDVSARYRDVVSYYRELIEYREHFCYTVTTPLAIGEAVRRIGMQEGDLLSAEGHDTLAEEGCLLIGQVGQAVVTFDEAGVGRFLRGEAALAGGCDYGIVQWDSYNLMFGYVRRDGGGGSWDEELRDDEESGEDMVAALRRGPLTKYADLFQRYLLAEEADDEEGEDPTYLQAVMLTVLELETGVRLDARIIGDLPYALHVPPSLR